MSKRNMHFSKGFIIALAIIAIFIIYQLIGGYFIKNQCKLKAYESCVFTSDICGNPFMGIPCVPCEDRDYSEDRSTFYCLKEYWLIEGLRKF